MAVRRAFLGVFLGRKAPPKGSAAWLARQLAHGHHDYTRAAGEGHPLACQLFGVEPRHGYYTATPDGLLGLLHGASDARAQVITLGLVLAACEAATRRPLLAQPDQLDRGLPAVPRRPRLHPQRRRTTRRPAP